MTETSQNLAFLPRNNKKALHFCKTYGADTRIRTGDLILTKICNRRLQRQFFSPVLCVLSQKEGIVNTKSTERETTAQRNNE